MLTPGERPITWLSWLAATYELGTRLRAHGYERGWFATRRLPVPVISIGNLTVGGTGKTPLVIQVTEWLLAAGKRVAVLSRGYRRTSREPCVLVSDGTTIVATTDAAGDEPFLIAHRCPRAVVAVGADRYQLGRWVLERCGADCIVLDDAFQHLALHRDVNLLLVDATDATGLERLLPAGRLREPISAAKRATGLIVTRAERPNEVDDVLKRLQVGITPLPLPTTAQVVFRAAELVSVMTGIQRGREWCKGKRALIVSGIGHAPSFRRTVEELGMTVVHEVAYGDHHAYSASDIERLREGAAQRKADLVVTTEKDAGKLRSYLGANDERWWAARLRVDWRTGEDAVRAMILDARSAAGEARA
ncbi:MAG TPA: tetraacyldisaccharide 4'-kinase [Nitrospira sp.]|nr:tetraacyldisaccharide 4'-kinase [Nitrospira sp.]